MVHRDIKPANLLLTSGGTIVKLADFGLTRIASTSNSTATMAGTALYMAPEVLKAEVSSPSDIWSVGVTVHELLTGKSVCSPPYDFYPPYVVEF